VCGIPVIFPHDSHSTFPAYLASLRISNPTDAWQLETLAINDHQKQQVRDLIEANENDGVDPVVRHLILATNGNAYAHQVGRLGQYPIPEIRLPLSNGERLLDLGCSWGRWCISAARRGYTVTGIDPSLGALLAALRAGRTFDVDCRYVCGDARQLPFAEGSFDVVHSYSVLQHFSDDDARSAWSEAARVLRPGGKAVIQMANVFGVRSLYHLARRRFRTATKFEVRYRMPRQLLAMAREALGQAGLQIDCFFGLGLQNRDRELYDWPARFAVNASNALIAASRVLPPLKLCADSLYVQAIKK
jgi:SAM-dependent methyltransferase